MRIQAPSRAARGLIDRPTTSLLRTFSCSAQRFASTDSSTASEQAPAPINPRWLSDIKKRIGTCVTFGLKPSQCQEAGSILQEVSRDWRELLLGSEGYLTGPSRRGLFRHRVTWGDQDAMGHVNNVMYNKYAECGRVEWAYNYGRYVDPQNAAAWFGLLSPSANGLILAKITTDFKFPMKYPDRVSVYHKLSTEPKADIDTFIFDGVILSELHQRPAARVIEELVLYDYEKATRTTLKPFMLEVLQETWRLQEEARRVYGGRVRSLLDRVRTLEIESWDREDAVEDMGSQKR